MCLMLHMSLPAPSCKYFKRAHLINAHTNDCVHCAQHIYMHGEDVLAGHRCSSLGTYTGGEAFPQPQPPGGAVFPEGGRGGRGGRPLLHPFHTYTTQNTLAHIYNQQSPRPKPTLRSRIQSRVFDLESVTWGGWGCFFFFWGGGGGAGGFCPPPP